MSPWKDPEKQKAWDKQYSISHRAERAAYHRAYYLAHREECNARSRAHYYADGQRARAVHRAYYQNHREECMAKQRAYRAAHLEERQAADHAYYASHKKQALHYQRIYKYGLPSEAYEALLKKQGNVCAICKTSKWGNLSPHVDHDHKTKVVRGILCHKCNTAIGLIRERPDIAREIARYLMKSSSASADSVESQPLPFS